jgi:hypothetical protein
MEHTYGRLKWLSGMPLSMLSLWHKGLVEKRIEKEKDISKAH